MEIDEFAAQSCVRHEPAPDPGTVMSNEDTDLSRMMDRATTLAGTAFTLALSRPVTFALAHFGTIPFTSSLSRTVTFALAHFGTIPFTSSLSRPITFALAFSGFSTLSFAVAGDFAFAFAFARTSLAGRTFFVGGGRAEREWDEPGDAEREYGIEPRFSPSGVCYHENTLMQGGVIADTRRHSCKGGCR